jgi:hypothetical protein
VFPEPTNMRLALIKQHQAELIREAEWQRLAWSPRRKRNEVLGARALQVVRSAVIRMVVALRQTLSDVQARRNAPCGDCES